MTAGQQAVRREVRGSLAQVVHTEPSRAVAAQRDGRLINPLFSTRVAEHDPSFVLIPSRFRDVDGPGSKVDRLEAHRFGE